MGSSAGLAPGFKEKVDGLVSASHGRVTITSGFRTRAQQIQARKDNGCPDIYDAPSSACKVPTARPGESQHEKGLAVDFGGDLALVAQLAPQYGLRATVKGEPWHYEPTGLFTGVAQVNGGAVDKTVGAIAGVGSDGGIVDGLLEGLKRITITGLILAGGGGLVLAGAYKASTGRSLAGDTAKVGTKAVAAVATDGASLEVETGAKGAKSGKGKR